MHNLSGKATVPLSTFGGLVTYASPDSVPSGTSPRNHDVDFGVGSFVSRKGTKSVYSFSGNSIVEWGTNAVSAAWSNPANAYSTSVFASASGIDVGPIDVTQFAFNVSLPVTGITVTLNGNCNTLGAITAQLLQDGSPIGNPKSLACPVTSFGGSTDLWGASPNINDTTFGVRFTASSGFALATFLLNSVTITASLANSSVNFQYIKSFPSSNGSLSTLAIDAEGEWWVEDVTNAPGVLSPLLSGLPLNGYAKSVTADDREYVCFNDLTTGNDVPRQYTGDWIDRVTQIGPGAPPVFTPQANTGNSYPILSITQSVQRSRGSSAYLQSAGPGSTSPGVIFTMYYAQTAYGGPDTQLVNLFQSGLAPLYVYVEVNSGAIFSPIVAQVTSVGQGNPPGDTRTFYYFTIAPLGTPVAFGEVNTVTIDYWITEATLTTSAAVPGLNVGSRATVTGASIANYNSTWLISKALNSGAMVITQTSVAAGVATYSYSLASGVAPTAGALVTVTGTTNANGALNVTNATISSASGSASGTFTVNVVAPDSTAASESGQATTAGTQFTFDPGAVLLGTSTSPVYGNSTGGQLIFAGTQQYISSGTRQGVVFFGTRNNAETSPSLPVIFTVPTNTSTLIASQIPIGPPNTTYRQISITEPGQNGVPGGDFYTIDDPVTYKVNGVSYTSNSFRIPNNTDTSISLTFRDSDLLAARRIDVQGQALFNQVEIGNPAWNVSYAGRLFYGLTQSKVQNFINLSFDGGYLPATTRQPLGWNIVGSGGSLIVSPIFGNSYYVKNTTGSTVAALGLITQGAYRDYYGVEIVRPDIPYSVRVTARIPSGNTTGNLVIDLYSSSQVLSSLTVPLSSLNTTMQQVSGTLLTSGLTPVPTDLMLRVYGTDMANGADYEIDRIEVFPTRKPVNETRLLVSYENNPEGVDGDTGAIETNSENTQPCYGAVVMYDLLYLLKDRSMYYTQDSSGDEPSKWGVHEVSNKAGACGVNAYDSGEEWIATANRNGVYIFTGGEPKKISQEIQQVWDAINWAAGKSVWLRNDVQERRMYIGVPLPTPNFWLPDAPANAAPAYPNVILICRYEGQSGGGELADASPISATFYGDVVADELRRKWSIWQIPCPYADFITRPDGNTPLFLGNGIGNSKVYEMSDITDDGAEIPWRYVTYGFGDDKDTGKFALLGSGRKRWNYFQAYMTGLGSALVKFWANRLDGSTSYSVPGGVALDSGDETRERPLNMPGNRVYIDISSGGLGSSADVSQIYLSGAKDVFNSIRGQP